MFALKHKGGDGGAQTNLAPKWAESRSQTLSLSLSLCFTSLLPVPLLLPAVSGPSLRDNESNSAFSFQNSFKFTRQCKEAACVPKPLFQNAVRIQHFYLKILLYGCGLDTDFFFFAVYLSPSSIIGPRHSYEQNFA